MVFIRTELTSAMLGQTCQLRQVFFFRVFFYHLQITFNLLVPQDLALEKAATFLRSESDTVEMAVTRHDPMESMKKNREALLAAGTLFSSAPDGSP